MLNCIIVIILNRVCSSGPVCRLADVPFFKKKKPARPVRRGCRCNPCPTGQAGLTQQLRSKQRSTFNFFPSQPPLGFSTADGVLHSSQPSNYSTINYPTTLSFAKTLKMEKKASESLVIMTELVLPNDTNNFGNLMGGRLMYWMDIAAALAAMKHCGAPVVTASVDNISFETPIKIGNVVHIEAKVTRAFNSSMEVHMDVWGEDAIQQYKYKSNEAYYTFVALDPNGKPRRINTLIPETEKENKLFEGALRRRQIRLILGGKMKPEDAEELKALFVK